MVITLSILGVYIVEARPEYPYLMSLPFIYILTFAGYQLIKGLSYIFKSIFSRPTKENLNNNSIEKLSLIDNLYEGIIGIFGILFIFLVTFSYPIGLIKYMYRWSDLSLAERAGELFMFIMPGANVYYVYKEWYIFFRLIIDLIFQNF
tara:strand:+ start:251 stop:694 length:444 start_codon:yes stop_codon:yes gene_type:complete